jgi:hypothetical protein
VLAGPPDGVFTNDRFWCFSQEAQSRRKCAGHNASTKSWGGLVPLARELTLPEWEAPSLEEQIDQEAGVKLRQLYRRICIPFDGFRAQPAVRRPVRAGSEH